VAVFSGHDLTCVRGERLVFEGLGFTLGAGGALLLLGANGSGKSSLLRLMAGLIRPAAGRIAWVGIDIAGDQGAHHGRVHYLGHLDAVKPVLTVRENLAFWSGLDGADRGATDAGLALIELDHLADTPGRFLSAGQRRRLALARLLAGGKPLWLMDEPSVALDHESILALEAALAAHRARGGMAVVATHMTLDLPGAEALVLDEFGPGGGGAAEGAPA
jgi:heme exporter protein A